MKNRQDEQKKLSLSVSKQEQGTPASDSNEGNTVGCCMSRSRNNSHLGHRSYDSRQNAYMGQRSYDLKVKKISSNDSRKFISNSGHSLISAYEAETSYDPNKEYNDSQQEFITTSKHSSNLSYDEARSSYDSNTEFDSQEGVNCS